MKQKLLFFITLCVLIAIPITIFVILSNLDNRSRAALSDAQELSARVNLLDQREGFAKESNVTGGANGTLCRVKNLSNTGSGSLRECAGLGNRWIIFDVDGTINLTSRINIASNTTIDGRGANITIMGKGLYFNGKENLIVENLKLLDIVGDNEDAVNIDSDSTRFWIDHLTIKNVADGYVDIAAAYKRGTQGTLSWNRMETGTTYHTWDGIHVVGDNRPCNSTDTKPCAQYNKLIQLTFHHNYFNATRQRHPSVNGAKVHTYNNYIKWRLYGMSTKSPDLYPQDHGQIYSENDIWDRAAAESNNQGDINNNGGKGYARVIGPLKLNGADPRESNPSGVFNPGNYYSYTAETANSTLKSKLETKTGWRPASEFNFGSGSTTPTNTPAPTIPPVITPSGNTDISPWTPVDIGNPLTGSQVRLSDGNYDLTGNGNDIYNTSDSFRFAYQAKSGDFTIQSRVVGLTNTHQYAKAGVMVRTSTASSSPYFFVFVTPGTNGAVLEFRTLGGNNAFQEAKTNITSIPKWVRIVKVGNTYTAYISDDGNSFTQLGTSRTIDMGTTPLAGMAVTSHVTGTLATGQFRNVTLSSSNLPTPTNTPTPTPTRTPTPTPTIQPPTPTTPPTGITPTQTPSKTGDINRDSNVDIFDLSILLSNWNTTNANADLNNDDQVNIFDLSILLSNWES